MAPPPPSGFNGVVQPGDVYAVGQHPPSATSSIQLPDFITRFVAVLTTFLAAVVMGATKQTVVVDGVATKLKTTGKGMSQLEFFIAANSIAFVYSAVSMALTVANKGPSGVKAVIAMVDLVMVGFVFSAVGSGAAMSVGFRDNGDVNICNVFDKYCSGVAAAVAMSTFGATAFLLLVLLVLLAITRAA